MRLREKVEVLRAAVQGLEESAREQAVVLKKEEGEHETVKKRMVLLQEQIKEMTKERNSLLKTAEEKIEALEILEQRLKEAQSNDEVHATENKRLNDIILRLREDLERASRQADQLHHTALRQKHRFVPNCRIFYCNP